jgi:hypothetical protein
MAYVKLFACELRDDEPRFHVHSGEDLGFLAHCPKRHSSHRLQPKRYPSIQELLHYVLITSFTTYYTCNHKSVNTRHPSLIAAEERPQHNLASQCLRALNLPDRLEQLALQPRTKHIIQKLALLNCAVAPPICKCINKLPAIFQLP